jgi:hypothetical protein
MKPKQRRNSRLYWVFRQTLVVVAVGKRGERLDLARVADKQMRGGELPNHQVLARFGLISLIDEQQIPWLQ